MAAITGRDLILYDRLPGPVNTSDTVPVDGFDSTKEGSGNCVTEPVYPLGTKVMRYNDGTYNPGWSTLAYLQFCEGSDSAFDAADPSTGYGLCFHYEATEHLPDGGNSGKWYAVTHDLTNSDGTRGGFAAIAVCDLSGADSTTTGAEYGWFWVGGVCPCITSPRVDCTGLGGAIKTDGDVVAGSHLVVIDDGTNAAALALACATQIFDGTDMDATASILYPIGWATKVDA